MLKGVAFLAMKVFDEMAELGIKLNVMDCTGLIQCLGKAKRIEDVVKVLEFATERGVQPDDRLCGCLLSVLSLCVMVLGLLEKSNPQLVSFITLISFLKEREESLPSLFSAHTGSGTHTFSQGLGSYFATHVKKLGAPFRQSEENVGCFVATREDVMSWVQYGALLQNYRHKKGKNRKMK